MWSCWVEEAQFSPGRGPEGWSLGRKRHSSGALEGVVGLMVCYLEQCPKPSSERGPGREAGKEKVKWGRRPACCPGGPVGSEVLVQRSFIERSG